VRILAIRLARFGDIVLLLPALSLLKAALPDSHLTFLTDQRWRDLAAMCPAIDEVCIIDRQGIRDGSYSRALADIVRFCIDLRRRKFDAAIDFHGFRETNLIAWWSRAPRRLGLNRADQSFLPFCFNLPPVLEDKTLHVSEMFIRVVQNFASTSERPQPMRSVVIPPEGLSWARQHAPANAFAVLYIDAPVKDRIWPVDRFVALADHLLKKQDTGVVVVTGREKPLVQFPGDVRMFANLTIPQLGALIGASRILVSNDTGPMHLGPALGIPTVGIFSVGLPVHFRPTGPFDTYVQGNPIETVSVSDVIDAVDRVWSASAR
jgi:ADP-heptose:LPS heptosyltransferase